MKDLGVVTLGLDEPVVTTKPVAEGDERGGLVIPQHSGVWQFIGPTGGADENAEVLHFSHLLQLDAALSQVRRLPPGGVMTRMPLGGPLSTSKPTTRWTRTSTTESGRRLASMDGDSVRRCRDRTISGEVGRA